ncbi:MAG TPA: 3-hydroxybutyryl-CoA dehydrogenase [Streptosporangiaceae bacterium]
MNIREVGVVGLGTMGAGIAEVFARGGLAVTAIEADEAALARGLAVLDRSLDRAVDRGRLTAGERAAIRSRVRTAPSVAGLTGADLVIEVVPEQLPVKRQVLAALDEVLRPDAIIATNTSSLSVTQIAAASARPGRVVGMHFFNPAPVMRLVEVVSTVLTDQASTDAITTLAAGLGKTPVQVSDRAGFVANALLLPYLNHAARLLETGCATREDIDLAVTAGLGLPMGPLALLDLIGLDTSLAILEVLDREFGGTRYTPAPLLRRLTDAGRTGRKAGRGFYDYGGAGKAEPAGDDAGQAAPPPGTVTILDPGAGEGEPAGSGELASRIAAAGVNLTRNPEHPSDLVLVATGPQGGVLAAAVAAGRAADAAGLHLTGPDPAKPALAELVITPATSPAAAGRARAMASRLGLPVVLAPDRPGLLAGALLFAHLRDCVAMVADGYASGADIDAAMTLGCGYPAGPLRMLAEADPGRAVTVLEAMHAGYGDPAFAPPPLLREYALAGLPAGN